MRTSRLLALVLLAGFGPFAPGAAQSPAAPADTAPPTMGTLMQVQWADAVDTTWLTGQVVHAGRCAVVGLLEDLLAADRAGGFPVRSFGLVRRARVRAIAGDTTSAWVDVPAASLAAWATCRPRSATTPL